MQENKVISIKEEPEDKFDYFAEFINIIINYYQKYPNNHKQDIFLYFTNNIIFFK